MIRKIISYVLIGTGILLYLFFKHYSGTIIPYPTLFFLAGIGMVVGGIVLLAGSYSAIESKEEERINTIIKELKSKGELIKVDLSTCEVKAHKYTEWKERYTNHKIQMWNTISGDDDKNIERVDVYQSVVIFHYKHNGESETYFSSVIPKDRETLLFKLYHKKETALYVDRNDRGRYYFDLDFLKN